MKPFDIINLPNKLKYTKLILALKQLIWFL